MRTWHATSSQLSPLAPPLIGLSHAQVRSGCLGAEGLLGIQLPRASPAVGAGAGEEPEPEPQPEQESRLKEQLATAANSHPLNRTKLISNETPPRVKWPEIENRNNVILAGRDNGTCCPIHCAIFNEKSTFIYNESNLLTNGQPI